jgi:hypothetical protein
MTAILIKNKRSHPLFRFKRFARRGIKIVKELGGKIEAKTKLDAKLCPKLETVGTVKVVRKIKGRIKVCDS